MWYSEEVIPKSSAWVQKPLLSFVFSHLIYLKKGLIIWPWCASGVLEQEISIRLALRTGFGKHCDRWGRKLSYEVICPCRTGNGLSCPICLISFIRELAYGAGCLFPYDDWQCKNTFLWRRSEYLSLCTFSRFNFHSMSAATSHLLTSHLCVLLLAII